MGMFNTVVIPCPICAYPVDFQSKSGPKLDLSIYLYPDVDSRVLMGIQHSSKCDGCENHLRVVFSKNGKRCALYRDCEAFDRLACKDG